MKASQEKNNNELSSVEQSHRQLERAIKEKDWELADVTAMKDAKYVSYYVYLIVWGSVEQSHRQLERAIKEKDWRQELADVTAMKDAK